MPDSNGPEWPSDNAWPDEDHDGSGGQTHELQLPEQDTVWVRAQPGPVQPPHSQNPPNPPLQQPREPGRALQELQQPPQSQQWFQSPPEAQETTPQQLPEPHPPQQQQQSRQEAPQPQYQPPPQTPPEKPQVPVMPATVHAMPMRIEPSGEQRPAAATTGTQEAVQEPPAAPVKRRRKWPWVAAILVVLLVLGGGAFAAVQPEVSNRLALPWAPNKPKGDPAAPQAVKLRLQGPGNSSPGPTADGVSGAVGTLASAGALGTMTGSVIDPSTGKSLWEKNGSQPLIPASTTKVLTAAAALLAVDHGLQLSTKVVQGPDPTTAILVAGGDLTINSLADGKDSVYPGAARLDDLVKQVMEASGGKIRQVQLDLGVYQGERTAPGWAAEDAPSKYAAPLEPLMLDGGRQNPTDDASQRVGDPAKAAGQKFADKIGATLGSPAKAPKDAKVLGELKSAPLSELVSQLLMSSDNNLADAVARQTAIATGQAPTYAGGAKATLDTLTKNKFDVTGAKLSDNSGLSLDNRVPAKVLAEVLAVAAAPDGKDERTAKLRPLLGGLPVAGGSGTLSDRYTKAPESAGKGWVRAKTGTIPSDGVNSLAGVVLDKDGHVLVFALMTTGADTEGGRRALDAVAAALRGCGCR